MRIGIFTESFAPVINGVSVSIQILTTRLEERGHQVWCFAPNYPGYIDDSQNVIRLRSILPKSMPEYPVALPPGRRAFGRFRDLKLDIVHTHTPFVVGLAGLKWAGRENIPVISTNHTLYTEYVHYVKWLPGWFTRRVAIGWMRSYYNRCQAVIVPSTMVGERLEQFGVTTPWRAIPTGIELPDTDADSASLMTRLGVLPGERLLVYVGRVAKEKNLELLLSSFAIVAAQLPNARLVIVGGGPCLQEYQQQAARMGLASMVTFAGPLERSQLPGLLSNTDLFVFGSTTETQGLAIGEAALCGVPCVAVRAGGVPDFVSDGETGYLVPNDAAEFAEKVLKLLTNEQLRKDFGERAHRKASAMSADAMLDRILETYEMALTKR